MLAHTILFLLTIGFFALIRGRQRFDYISAVLVTILTGTVFYYFLQDWKLGIESGVRLLWDSSRSGDIKIDIVSSDHNYLFVFPFFVMTLVALFNDLFFRYEQKKRYFSAVLVLNLVCLMMLIVGNNFVQIITFVFAIDILSHLLIKDVHAGRRYSIYNLVADMLLFLVLAMIHGRLENLDVANITSYYETGRHRDFIVIMIMISLFIKFGFFLFQGCLLDLKSAKFHRLILVPYLSTPAAALILLLKFYPLLIVSPSFLPILNVFLLLTFLWGTGGAIIINNLKEKTIYLDMMVLSLMVKLIESADFMWNMHFSWLLVLGFLFNNCIYTLHYYSGRENNLAYIAKFKIGNLLPLRIILLIITMIIAAFTVQLCAVYGENNAWFVIIFGILFTLCTAHLFNMLFGISRNQIQRYGFDYRPLSAILLSGVGAGVVFYQENEYWRETGAVIVLFFGWLAAYPLKGILVNNLVAEKWQNIDVFSRLYDLLIAVPLKAIGRLLTLFVDFVFLERTIIRASSIFSVAVIRGFRKLSRRGVVHYLLGIVMAIAIFSWCFLKGRL